MSEQSNNFEIRLGALSSEFSGLKELIKTVFQKIEHNFDVVKKDVESIHKKIEVLDKRVEMLTERVERLATGLESLDTTTNTGFTGVGMKIESLTDEIAKIAIVTSYDEQFKNLKGLN